MESEPNALLTALGGYGSDDSDGDSAHSSSSEAIYPLPLPAVAEMEDDEYESDSDQYSNADEFELEIDNTGVECGGDTSSLLLNAEASAHAHESDLAAYERTKRDLDLLLGCSQVADIASQVDATECPAELQAKFAQWYDLKRQGANFNETLMRNKTFRNPNIYQWLVDHLGLEEAGSNMPTAGFSPAELRRDFSPEALAEEQERRARETAAKKSAEAAPGNLRKMNFNSAGHEAERFASAASRGDYRTNKYDRFSAPQSRAQTSSIALPAGGQAPASTAENSNTIEDAIQRARQIAQHLVGARKQ
ncbi:hypothetical protein GGI20_001532 [Coemansia sp. BCRC 34301]|nr:hypothetical protein GGI20_001532 [Coemansia sp. BCRC 34301]